MHRTRVAEMRSMAEASQCSYYGAFICTLTSRILLPRRRRAVASNGKAESREQSCIGGGVHPRNTRNEEEENRRNVESPGPRRGNAVPTTADQSALAAP